MATKDAPRSRSSSTRSGSSGCEALVCHQVNAVSSTAPAARKPQASGELQSWDSALEKPYTMPKRPVVTRTVPGMSSLEPRSRAVRWSSRKPPTRAKAAMKRLT